MTETHRARPRPRGVASTVIPALTLALLGVLSTAGPALADCAAPPPLEVATTSAEIVFVGTVNSVEGEGLWANVSVSEVWRGPDLEAIVSVHGGVAPGEFGEDDRRFEVGLTYLFFPFVEDRVLRDNLCSPTTTWAREMDKLRPADARPPIGGSPTQPGTTAGPLDALAPWIGPVVAALGLGFAALTIAFVAARRRDG